MPTRVLAVLLSLALTGCFKTTQVRPTDLSSDGLKGTEGSLIVVPKSGDVRRFDAPYRALAKDDELFVNQELMPSERFETAHVERLDVRTYSGNRTGLLVGVTVFLVAGAALGIGLGASAWGAQLFRFGF